MNKNIHNKMNKILKIEKSFSFISFLTSFVISYAFTDSSLVPSLDEVSPPADESAAFAVIPTEAKLFTVELFVLLKLFGFTTSPLTFVLLSPLDL